MLLAVVCGLGRNASASKLVTRVAYFFLAMQSRSIPRPATITPASFACTTTKSTPEQGNRNCDAHPLPMCVLFGSIGSQKQRSGSFVVGYRENGSFNFNQAKLYMCMHTSMRYRDAHQGSNLINSFVNFLLNLSGRSLGTIELVLFWVRSTPSLLLLFFLFLFFCIHCNFYPTPEKTTASASPE